MRYLTPLSAAVVLICLSASIFPSSADAQTPPLLWQRCYGGDSADYILCTRQANDGGFIAAGWTRSSDGDLAGNAGVKGLWVLKTDATGNIQWERTYNDTMLGANYIDLTSDGGYIVTGSQTLKLHSDGSIQWAKNLFGYAVHQAADGGYMLAGSAYNLQKLDTAGNMVWQYNYAPTFENVTVNDVCTSLTNDGYVFSGDIVDIYSSPLIAKVDNSGTLTAPLNNSYHHGVGGRVCKTTDGHYLWTNGSSHTDSIIKLDAGLSETWGISASGGSISPTADNGFTTLNGGSFTGADMFLTKYDASGNQQWRRTINGSQTAEPTSALQTVSGNYMIAGTVSQNDSEISGVHGDKDGWIAVLGYNTSVPQVKNAADINVYPVPAAGQLFIDLPEKYTAANIRLMDAAGKILLKDNSSTRSRSMDISSLPAGDYLVEVQSGSDISTYKVAHY